MKKKFLIAFGFSMILGACNKTIWAAPDFFQDYTHYFSYDDKTFITGGKLLLSLGEARFSTDFSNYNYGFSIFTKKYFPNFPCIFQGGNISIGGIVSRLKNPSLDSDTGGFSSCYTQPASITSALPAFSSFTNPFSTFIQFGYDDDKTFLQELKVNGTYTPSTHSMNFSALGKIHLHEKYSFRAASGISLHNIEEKQQTSWYSDIPFYEAHKDFWIGNQLAVNILDIFQSHFSLFVYPSAIGKYGVTYKLENKAVWDDFIAGLSAFINPNSYLITSENTVLNPTAELKTNFQYKFIPELKTGITIYTKFPLTPPIAPSIKTGFSTTLTVPITTLSTSCTFSFQTGNQFVLTYASSKIQSTWKLGLFTPMITLSSRLYFSSSPKSEKIIPAPELNTQIHSTTIKINFMGDLLSASSSFSFGCNNHEIYNKKLNLSLIFNGKYKKILILVKINGEFCI